MSSQIASTVYLDHKTYKVMDVKDGGMGRVWLLKEAFSEVSDPIYKKLLAVKTFDYTPNQYSIEQELNFWVSLEHKNILPLLRIGRLNYRLAAIMPWRHSTLEDQITQYDFSEKEIVKMALQIAHGLKYAYENWNIVHLDLKPANVLIRSMEPFELQISDWGISRITAQLFQATLDEKRPLSQYTSYGAGTPLYMSPERFSNRWKISPQADMYSLGLIIIQLFSGFLPSRIEEIISGSYIKNVGQILKVKSYRLEKLLYSCINPDVSLRPKSYAELISKLKKC